MVDTNDNEGNDGPRVSSPDGPDAHGQAAFLLLESLIHHLVASSVMTNEAAIEVVEVALDVKVEVAHDLGDSAATLKQSLSLLERLASSLQSDTLGQAPETA